MQHKYDVTLGSGPAIAIALVAADNEEEAKEHALARAAQGEVAWNEGEPTGPVVVTGVEDLGPDDDN